jgi:hypothetical protein
MDASVAPKDVSYDDFEKNVDGALGSVDERAVRVHRGSGQDDLVVTTESRLARQIEALRSASRVIRSKIDGATHHEAVVGEFEWASVLPDADGEIFYRELIHVVEIDDPEHAVDTLLVLIDQWRNTAEVWADPDLLESLQSPVSDHGPVTA